MADTRKIVIEIQGGSSSDKTENSSKNLSDELNKIFHPIKSIEKATVGKNVFLNQAYQQAKNLIIQTVETGLNKYFSLSEDYIGQNSYTQAKTIISKGSSLISSVAGGAMMGGAAGAIIGLTGWTINQTISYQARISGYYESLNATNYSLNNSRLRAGLSDNGKGTEN